MIDDHHDDWLMSADQMGDNQPTTTALVAEYGRDADHYEAMGLPLGSLWRRQEAARLRKCTYLPTQAERLAKVREGRK